MMRDQTVCNGCFAPFPYAKPTDPRLMLLASH